MKNLVAITLFLASITTSAAAKNIEEILEDAEEGSKSALYTLGVRYSIGNDVKPDQELANQYYAKSAMLGYAPAQNNLGWSYRQGLAVKKNPAKAIYWFRLSALQGNALALQNLAEMYQQGEGIPKDLEIARSFFVLCATEAIGEVPGRESGFNNAVHECRREVGKIDAIAAKDDQKALRRAAMWFSVALTKDKDTKLDSEKGVKARRSRKETEELLKMVNDKLTAESRKWVNDALKEWNDIRVIIKDRTPFPLVQEECMNDDQSL